MKTAIFSFGLLLAVGWVNSKPEMPEYGANGWRDRFNGVSSPVWEDFGFGYGQPANNVWSPNQWNWDDLKMSSQWNRPPPPPESQWTGPPPPLPSPADLKRPGDSSSEEYFAIPEEVNSSGSSASYETVNSSGSSASDETLNSSGSSVSDGIVSDAENSSKEVTDDLVVEEEQKESMKVEEEKKEEKEEEQKKEVKEEKALQKRAEIPGQEEDQDHPLSRIASGKPLLLMVAQPAMMGNGGKSSSRGLPQEQGQGQGGSAFGPHGGSNGFGGLDGSGPQGGSVFRPHGGSGFGGMGGFGGSGTQGGSGFRPHGGSGFGGQSGHGLGGNNHGFLGEDDIQGYGSGSSHGYQPQGGYDFGRNYPGFGRGDYGRRGYYPGYGQSQESYPGYPIGQRMRFRSLPNDDYGSQISTLSTQLGIIVPYSWVENNGPLRHLLYDLQKTYPFGYGPQDMNGQGKMIKHVYHHHYDKGTQQQQQPPPKKDSPPPQSEDGAGSTRTIRYVTNGEESPKESAIMSDGTEKKEPRYEMRKYKVRVS